jgi:hypothetical protein
MATFAARKWPECRILHHLSQSFRGPSADPLCRRAPWKRGGRRAMRAVWATKINLVGAHLAPKIFPRNYNLIQKITNFQNIFLKIKLFYMHQYTITSEIYVDTYHNIHIAKNKKNENSFTTGCTSYQHAHHMSSSKSPRNLTSTINF